MSKTQVALLCVVLVAGLALGFMGRDFFVPKEETKLMNQLAKEEQDGQKRVKEEAPAVNIIAQLRQASSTLSMFYMKNSKEIGENYDLGAALATPELIREKLKDYVRDPDMYNDGHWIFQGKGKKWWIGYKLDGVSEAVRQKLVQQASFSNLYKTVNEDDGAYDGGDVVFMPM